jgi:ABC-2 type transport system permease protein
MTLVMTIARRRVIDVLRYPFELIFGLVAFYAFFVVLFLGAKSFGGDSVSSSSSLSAIAVGYVVFMLTQQSYQSFGNQLMNESATGTLEQLAMNRHGLMAVLLVDFLIQSLIAVFQIGWVIVPIMATTGRWLHFDAVSVSILLAVMMSGVVGLGLALGGLALVFKRIAGVSSFVSFGFLFLVAAPVDRYPLLKLLPVVQGNAVLRRVLVGGESLFDQTASNLLILGGVPMIYLVVGSVIFARMEREARIRALLGQY